MDKNYCEFYLVRHGETELNVKRIMQGHRDSSLTEIGISQAKDLGRKLKFIHFDAVFSSDLLRARRTAEIITAEKNLTVSTTKLLRERSFGKYEGWEFQKYFDRFEKDLKKYKIMTEKELFCHKLDQDIESDEEVVGRFLTFIREVALGYLGKRVLLVSHGGLIRTCLIHLGFGTRQQLIPGCIKNTAYVRFLSDGTEFFVKETHNIEMSNDK